MSIFENSIDYKDSPRKVKEIIKELVNIFGEDSCEIINRGKMNCEVKYLSNDFNFEIFNVKNNNFSLEVFLRDWKLFSHEYSDINSFIGDMKFKLEYGFEDAYGDTAYFRSDETNENEPVELFSDCSDEDEEISQDDLADDYQEGLKLAMNNSIVPDGITKIRVVALRFEGNIIAFRFKTDKGAFDMRIEVAIKYGLGGFKTEKFINLERVNGILMSSTEKKLKTCVPDVSLCEKDCKKLVDAIFNA